MYTSNTIRFRAIWRTLRKLQLLAFLFALTALSSAVSPASTTDALAIPVWTYHAYPPFIVDQKNEKGLTYDLARFLTNRSGGRFHFEVVALPRLRVDNHLSQGDSGVVFWVNNAWFGDPNRKKYLWTDTIMRDSNSVISPVNSPVEYLEPNSLNGLNLVGVRGHHYKYIDDLVTQKMINRLDVGSEDAAINFVANGRADVSILARSFAGYYSNINDITNRIYFSDNPHSRYERYILIQPQLIPVMEYLRTELADFKNNVDWLDILKEYSLNFDSELK